MSYKYNNVVIKPGLYLGDQGTLTGDTGASSPIFSSMQLSLDGTNGLSRRDDNLFLLPGYKAILYKNDDISYSIISTIDNTTGSDIKGVWYTTYNTAGANQISKVDLFYNNVKIDYSNIKTMGFKAAARLCWGAKLGEHSDGSYNKYALVLESSTPRLNSLSTNDNETDGIIGINRPHLSLPWVQAIKATKASHSFWWCSKGYESGVGNADISYALNKYSGGTNYVNGTIFCLTNNSSVSWSQINFMSPTTGKLTFYINATTYTSDKNICDGLWHHIVWNINGTTWDIYTDGVLETIGSKASYDMTTAITTCSSQIGSRFYPQNDITTNGYIADFRFYKNTLSTTDINGLLNGDHTYRTALDVSSCLFQYTFDPDAVYTNNYTTYAIGAATVPYAAELRNGADILMPSMDLTDSIGKNIKIYPFTIGSNGFSISFWWRSDGFWATQGTNSRLFYLGNGDETTNITFSLRIGSNEYPCIEVNYINSYLIIDGITPFIWYKFDGDVVNYGSGTGLNGTGTPSYSSSTVAYGTQSLNLTSSFNVPSINLNSLNGITFSWWVNSITNSISATFTNGTDSFDFDIGTNASIRITKPTFGESLVTNLNSGKWNHLAVSMTYSSVKTSTWKCYLNGILETTFTNRPYFSVNNYTTNTIGNTNGFFDDFRIYKTVLTDAQIRNISNYNTTQNLTTLTDFCDDTWKHVVWTIATDSTWKLYVNNALITTYTGMAYPAIIQRSTNYIGSGYLTTDGVPCGFIGDFRMYNAALSSTNVTSLYNRTDTTNNEINLIQHYDFVEDTMNANNNILYSNAPKYALELTNATGTTGATGQYGFMSSGLAETGTNGLTISFWWKAKGGYAAQGANYGSVFDFGSSTTNGSDGIEFYVRWGTNAYPGIQVRIDNTNSAQIALTTLTDFCDGDWKHVVWTMTYVALSTSNTSTWNLYVNNKRYGLGNLTTVGYYPNNIARGNAYFGRTWSSTFNYANGYIADFRVYKELFTLEKITDLYNKVYTDTTNLLLHTLYPNKTAPSLANGAKIPFTSSKTEIQPQVSPDNYYIKPDNYYSLYVNSSLNQYAFSSTLPRLTANTVGVSFSFWWKANSSTQTSNSRIFNFGNSNTSIANTIYFMASIPEPRVGFFGSLSVDRGDNVAVTGFNNGLWKHVVWTMSYSSGSTSKWRVYINNVVAYTGDSREYPNDVSRNFAAIGTQYLNSAASSDYSANGYIADFRVYDIVLTQTNVTNLYNKVYVSTTDLLIQYPKNFSDTLFTLQSGATIVQEPPTQINNIYPSLKLATDPSLNYHRGSYLSIPPLVKTGTNGLSFSIWWKSNATYANQGPWSRLFSFSNGKARDTIEFILKYSTNSYPGFFVHNGIQNSSHDINNITSFTLLCDGTWKHIVWTMTYCAPTQTTSTWIVYVNGTATSVTTSGTYPKDVSRKYAYIGQSASILDLYPTGNFADFRVYGTVLTQANVNSLFDLTDTTDKEDKLLLRQKFDSTESYLYQTCDNIKPSVLLENDTAITNTSTGQHVVLPTLPGLLSTDVPDRRGISISFWWKSKGLSGTSGMLFESGLKEADDVLFLRTRSALNTYMNAQYFYGPGIDTDFIFTTSDGDIENLENGEWHHIVWTLSFEGNDKKSYWKFYMDGYFIKTSTLLTTAYLESLNTYAPKQINNFIGRSNWAVNYGCLNGYMSDFRIYNKCLTTQDVGDLYTNTYDDNSDLFLRYSFEKKIQIDNSEYTNIKEETDPSIIILLEGGATVVDNDTVNSPSGFSSFLQLSSTTAQWARLFLSKSFTSTSQTGLSFSFWFKPTGTHGASARIFDFGNGEQNDNILMWKSLTDKNYPTLYVINGTATPFYVELFNWNTFFSNQNWKHVVFTLTPSTGTTSTWNAYLDKSRYGNANLTDVGRYPSDIIRTSNLIGKSNWINDNGGLLGNITGFRIYTTILSQNDVTALYNNTFTDTTNLFFSTDFKPKYNINLTPSHSTDTTQVARLYNGATLSTDTYKFGTSSLFLSNYTTTENVIYTSGPGFGQCMQTIAPLPKLGTNGISFSFWWKSAGTQGTSSTIFDFTEDANNRITFYDVSNSSTSPVVQLITGNGTKYDYNLNKTNFNNSEWHHVVWNINKSNNTWEIFYDNVSTTITSKMYPENVSRPCCFFGRSTVAAELYANGYIDEFRIYSKALTATNVANLYTNIDSTSLRENLILYYSFNQDASKKVMDETYLDNNVIDTPIFNT